MLLSLKAVGKVSSRAAFSLCSIIILAGGGSSVAATLLFSGATVHTVSGDTISPGQVSIKDAGIVAVGKTLSAPDAQTIELNGLHLYPGLIALNTVLGLSEIESVRATQDSTEVGDFDPAVESWVAVNPDSELLPVTRANGIAYFEPVPHGGIIAGQSGLVSMEGWTVEQRTIKKPIALHLFWPAMELDVSPREGPPREGPRGAARSKSLEEQAKERTAKIRSLQDYFEEAKHYAKAKAAAAAGRAPAAAPIPDWEAMLPYVRGELPIMVHADELRQIKSAVQWSSTNGYKIILAGARDAWRLADMLASNKVSVLYGEPFALPPRDTTAYDAQFHAPEVLRKAGVQVAFCFGSTVFDAPLARNLPYCAAQSVAFGLPEAEALKGITLYPAQIAGVSDRLGSIEPGKEATLVAADGDILDIRSQIKRMWIAGKEISLESRHTRLYEKYKNRPKAQ
jgi:imidazolonepropionase-like amidohydrolase